MQLWILEWPRSASFALSCSQIADGRCWMLLTTVPYLTERKPSESEQTEMRDLQISLFQGQSEHQNARKPATVFRNFTPDQDTRKRGEIPCMLNYSVPAAAVNAGLGYNETANFFDVIGIIARASKSTFFEKAGDDGRIKTHQKRKQKIRTARIGACIASYDNGWSHTREAAEAHGEFIAWEYNDKQYVFFIYDIACFEFHMMVINNPL
ncbi:hypothetical protein DFS34DRAFT_337472 [Phlyctochytrium arcticum]|nr:hypothetical protein DFS34DRAFT_337472 [Phlyctochytrium arcticum]